MKTKMDKKNKSKDKSAYLKSSKLNMMSSGRKIIKSVIKLMNLKGSTKDFRFSFLISILSSTIRKSNDSGLK